jgi:two-component system, cell cycle sensor histidine kinase and response regulator CckA
MVIKDAADSERRAGGGGTETILLADDEPSIRRSMKRALEGKGYAVLVAEDGEVALALFREHRSEVALVITDMNMPKMGGRKLVETLRAEGESVKVLFTSGHAADEMSGTDVLPNTVAFLQKPWTLDDLFSRVRATLDGAADRD